MREFNSLTAALEGYFEKPLAELPSADQPPGLRERVLEVFNLISWGTLSPDQRRQVAQQWDAQNDPSLEQERQRTWDAQVKCIDLEREITEWQLMPAPTPTERIAKERRIAELQQKLVDGQQALSKMSGMANHPIGRRASTLKDGEEFRAWADAMFNKAGKGPSRDEAERFAMDRNISREWGRQERERLPLRYRRDRGERRQRATPGELPK